MLDKPYIATVEAAANGGWFTPRQLANDFAMGNTPEFARDMLDALVERGALWRRQDVSATGAIVTRYRKPVPLAELGDPMIVKRTVAHAYTC